MIKDKRILLTKRTPNKESFPNHWTFPAGRVEPSDDSLESTAIREVKEEVNLDFVPEKKLNFYESRWDDTRSVSHVFIGSFSGELRHLESEVSETGWFTYDETKELDIAFAYMDTIDDLRGMDLL
ncbi:NUDIX hydrolase [Candidatus Woesearchaeota archaeon]|nr:NUDIX hydrolase [Candidatus Woesearchaeota archaeon]